MNIPELLQQLTLEEKASLCSGGDFWHTKAIKRLGIPAMMMSDGPHGLRKQDETGDHLGVNDSIKAVRFPAGCATASSFDRALVERMGKALGNECQAENVGVLLGPAVNIKRSPLCGRNFEYYSEDPYVAGEMATAFIQGVQSQGVGTSIKHFYANNQEHRRMSSSSEMSERTAREIYLAAFARPIRKARPWTVMCAYNRINGVYAAENKEALTDILRGEWNFNGIVVSDWGAVNDRVADLEAGMDLEMPSSFGMRDAEIVKAVRCGRLPEAALDRAVTRILRVVQCHLDGRRPGAVFDRDADHELAREIAAQCMVLLKNEENILPLDKTVPAAFIGKFAESPRFQGGGSSHINCHKVESALEMAKDYPVTYARGYETADDVIRDDLMAEAVAAARAAKVAVVFAGLPDTFESEGYDREHMRLPDCQNALIEAVAKANPNTVVVLHGGSPVEMPWLGLVKGVLEAYLCGQAVGGATVQILYGDVNPSGHLAETFPVKLEDNPSYVAYQGEGDVTEYREGVFVGYRYYATKKMPVLFPFGYGLSYTTFAVSNLRTERDEYQSHDIMTVWVDVTNTGDRAGKEVVQLYVLPQTKTDAVQRPVQELRGFEKVELQPGETRTVTFTLHNSSAFSYYCSQKKRWVTESGVYKLAAGNASDHLTAEKNVRIHGERALPAEITLNTTIGDILRIPGADQEIVKYAGAFGMNSGSDENAMGESTADMMEAMMRYMPIRGLLSFGGGEVSIAECKTLVEKLNVLLEQANLDNRD